MARRKLKGKAFPSEEDYYYTLFRMVAHAQRTSYEKVRDWYFNRYMPLTVSILKKHYHAREDVPALFEWIHARGGKIAVISDYGYVREKLDAIGIREGMVDFEFEAPALGGLKPCRITYERMLDTMKIDITEALMVGDRLDTDGRGAIDSDIEFFYIDKKADTWKDLIDNTLKNDSL